MRTARQAQREARGLFRLCLSDGQLDERRVRLVVDRVLATAHAGDLAVLTRFERLVKGDRARHRITVASAMPLPSDVRSEMEHRVRQLHLSNLELEFVEDATLL